MKTIQKWWLRRRLLARLRRVREQKCLLSAERTTTLELLNEACQDLIRYRAHTQVHATRVIPTRNRVNALAIQLNMLGLQVMCHEEQESQLQSELETI